MGNDRLQLAPGMRLRGTPYVILRKIGGGGMGMVYEAEHARLKTRRVALKLLANDLRSRDDNVRRMELEGETLARLSDHPNIVYVHDLGVSEDGLIFLAMERLEGQDLRRLLIQRHRFTFEDALTIVEEVLDALAHAHREGVVHRDVKPENVFLAKSGAETITKLLDFGIARVMEAPSTLTGSRYIGTPYYSAPEQVRGEPPTEKVDIYAVGCVLFELLSGRRPFAGTPREVLGMHLHEQPPRVSELVRVPRALDDLVARALEKDPAARPTSALWFSHQLNQIRRLEAGVELASANTTQETLLTAITEASPSTPVAAPPPGDAVDATLRDPIPLGAQVGETTPDVRTGGERTRAEGKRGELVAPDSLRHARTRTGDRDARLFATERLTNADEDAPGAEQEDVGVSAREDVRSLAGAVRTPSRSEIDLPVVAPSSGRIHWGVAAGIVAAGLAGALAIVLIGPHFVRPRESAAPALAESTAPPSSAVAIPVAPSASVLAAPGPSTPAPAVEPSAEPAVTTAEPPSAARAPARPAPRAPSHASSSSRGRNDRSHETGPVAAPDRTF